jgi:diacylglycerol kinase family enzyme
MNVICVKKIPIPFLPFVASLLFIKRFEQSMYVDSYKAKRVHIHNEGLTAINIDGEYCEKEGNITLQIRERSLNVIAPSQVIVCKQ